MNDFNKEIIDNLEIRLKKELHGITSHLKMAPLIGDKPYRGFKPPHEFYSSAVLVLLTADENNELSFVLTLRSSNLNSHKGQISFPGGKSEFNETPVMTALREAKEEIGIAISDVQIIGTLSNLYVPPSNSYITPIVGFLIKKTEFVLNKQEVEEIIIVPIKTLNDSSKKMFEIWKFNNQDVEVPFWNVHSHTPLWGATAMIISEFLDAYNELQK